MVRLVVLAAAVLVLVVFVPQLLSRRKPTRHSASAQPWTPELGPFRPARGSYGPEVQGLVATGLAAYVLVFAFRGDYSIGGIVSGSLGFMVAMVVVSPDNFSDARELAESVPSDAPVDRAGSPQLPRTFTLDVVTLALVVVGVVVHVGETFLIPASLLGRAYVFRARERRLARWEDQHGVEFVRLPGSGRVYVRREEADGGQSALGER